MKINFRKFFTNSNKREENVAATSPMMDEEVETALSFDELNPLLAKQLSEMEVQIGQLAQVQYELAEERGRMRSEMDALKKVLQENNANPSSAGLVKQDNEAT